MKTSEGIGDLEAEEGVYGNGDWDTYEELAARVSLRIEGIPFTVVYSFLRDAEFDLFMINNKGLRKDLQKGLKRRLKKRKDSIYFVRICGIGMPDIPSNSSDDSFLQVECGIEEGKVDRLGKSLFR